MRALLLALTAAAFCLSLASGLVEATQDKQTTKVEGTFIIPQDIASFDGRVVEIRLYRHDPRIADKPADLVEKVDLTDFSHAKGKETRKDFTIGAKGNLDPKMGYYVTLFILQKDKRTHIGECEHSKRDLCKVLTNGEPNKITMNVREVRK